MTVRLGRNKSDNQKAYVRALALLIVVPAFLFAQTTNIGAQDLNQRSLRVTTSVPGAASSHIYNFEIMTAGVVGSIVFEYCVNSPLFTVACSPPAGLDVSGASVSGQGGETGFSVHGNTTVNKMILTRPPVPAVPAPANYSLANVVNPSTPSQSVYVRISTYASDDGTGPDTDRGAVVFSTSGGLGIGGYVPPYLTFCVGLTVGNACSSATGSSINLGLLSKNNTSVATSQFAGATNDFTGYNVFITGTTMISGNNIIPALGAPTASSLGTSQFGINLRANSDPTVGQNPVGSGTAAATPNYNIPNRFVFNSGDNIANSPLSTDFNTTTVSYMVNVNESQPPGVYAATFTYIATASF